MKSLLWTFVSLGLLLIGPHSARADATAGAIAPSGALAPANQDFETRTLGLLKALLTQLSVSKDIRVELIDGTNASEFKIYYHPGDEAAVRGLGGTTQSAITTLVNELSIAQQRDDARAANQEFDLHHRRPALVRFIKLEE